MLLWGKEGTEISAEILFRCLTVLVGYPVEKKEQKLEDQCIMWRQSREPTRAWSFPLHKHHCLCQILRGQYKARGLSAQFHSLSSSLTLVTATELFHLSTDSWLKRQCQRQLRSLHPSFQQVGFKRRQYMKLQSTVVPYWNTLLWIWGYCPRCEGAVPASQL